MKILLSWLVLFLIYSAQSQTLKDADFLEEKIIGDARPKGSDRVGGLFGLYSNHLSDQILNDCIYDQSCSTFSRGVFKNYGFIKGLMLTADRLTRCNRATFAQIDRVHLTPSGKAVDHWEDYAGD